MKICIIPLIVALLCFNSNNAMDEAVGRTLEVTGGVCAGAGTVFLGALTTAATWGVCKAGEATRDIACDLNTPSYFPTVCRSLALTTFVASIASILAGMAWEAGAYSLSLLRSTPRPPAVILGFAFTCLGEMIKNGGKTKYHVHTHYHY